MSRLPEVGKFDGFIAGLYRVVYNTVMIPAKGIADWVIRLHDWVKRKAKVD